MNGFIKAAFIFWGARIVFVGETRIDFVWEHELFTNCSEFNETFNETMNGH